MAELQTPDIPPGTSFDMTYANLARRGGSGFGLIHAAAIPTPFLALMEDTTIGAPALFSSRSMLSLQ